MRSAIALDSVWSLCAELMTFALMTSLTESLLVWSVFSLTEVAIWSTMVCRPWERVGFFEGSVWVVWMVAWTAPHLVWPMTTRRRVPKLSAANSADPSSTGVTMFPATRMMNMSPMPWSKTISGGTRESEQLRTMVKGVWLSMSLWVRWSSADWLATKRLLPSLRMPSAFCAEIMVFLALCSML